MTANEYLQSAGAELGKIRPAPSGTYELVVLDSRIVVRKYDHTNPTRPVIARLKSDDVNGGCTSKMWDKIEARIRRFVEKGLLT